MNTEELAENNVEVQNRSTANLFAVQFERQNDVSEHLFASHETDSNQRQLHRNPEFCLLTSLEASSDRENSGFSIIKTKK